MKVHSIFSGSVIALALLSISLTFSATTLSAESYSSQDPKPATINPNGSLGEKIAVEEAYIVPPTSYVATAYSLHGRTASGRPVAKGLIAADPRHLPLGSRVRLEAGNYSGEYLVADTGNWLPNRKVLLSPFAVMALHSAPHPAGWQRRKLAA